MPSSEPTLNQEISSQGNSPRYLNGDLYEGEGVE